MFRRVTRLAIGATLAAGVAAVPAGAAFAAPAATYTDTSVQAEGFTGVSQASTCSAPAAATVASGAKSLTFTAASGDTFSAATFTDSAGGTATASVNGAAVIAITGSAGTTGSASPDILKFKISDPGGCVSVETAKITETAGALTQLNTLDTVAFSGPFFATDDSATGGVAFHAAGSSPLASYAVTLLPAGLDGGIGLGELRPGTAVPGRYNGVHVTVTDSAGAVGNGTVNLQVNGQTSDIGEAGDNVNKFGNGFDVYQQRAAVNTEIVGWPATQHDPATHFLLESGTASGTYRYEYAPDGTGTGLCVANPDGGYYGDPGGPTGLVLRDCNTGVFQEFSAGPDHELISKANGQIVDPHGTGGQLATGTSAVSWGGSAWKFVDYYNLPA